MNHVRWLAPLALAVLIFAGCDDAQKLLDDAKKKADEALATKPATPPATTNNIAPGTTEPVDEGPVNPVPTKPTDQQLIAEWNAIPHDIRSDSAIQRLLLASPESLKEVTEFDLSQSGGKVTVEGYKALQKFPLVKSINAAVTEMSVEKLAEISKLPELEVLNLARCALQDGMMAPLSKLSTLRDLNVSGNAVSDQGLMAINRLAEVQVLSIDSTSVTGSALLKANYLGGLRTLGADETSFGPSGFQALKSAPNLEVLRLALTPTNDANLAALNGAKNLREASLRGCSAVSDVGFAHLKGNAKLEALDLSSTNITGRALVQLKNCKKLNRVVCNVDEASKIALRKALPECEIP